MLPRTDDGRLQVIAGVSLLNFSRLVVWNAETQFAATSQPTFESSWRQDFDPVFGRLICWINFSAGAELLAKGVCLSRDVEFRTEKPLPAYPVGDLEAWARRYRANWKCDGTLTATNFKTLGTLTNEKNATLMKLCAAVGATTEGQNLVIASYDFLCRTIRNRDAHAYVPNIRESHFSLVPELFVPCFNLLIAWLPGGPSTLNTWRAEAASFIESL